jgi:hypothetical protein
VIFQIATNPMVITHLVGIEGQFREVLAMIVISSTVEEISEFLPAADYVLLVEFFGEFHSLNSTVVTEDQIPQIRSVIVALIPGLIAQILANIFFLKWNIPFKN